MRGNVAICARDSIWNDAHRVGLPEHFIDSRVVGRQVGDVEVRSLPSAL
jgi:hypothetical protein